MEDSLLYAVEKYWDALSTLATGQEEVRKRLLAVFVDIFLISPSMVPDKNHVREDIEWIQHQMTRFKTNAPMGDVGATMSRIRKSTAVKIAERIVLVYSKLCDIEECSE